jgi:CheY-like chemotaxis protein
MKATAFIVGSMDGAGATLTRLARRLDFEAVLPFADLTQADEQVALTPVCFFLFAPVADVETLRRTAEAIRFAPSRRIRFSPLVYFSDSPSIETIGRCINLGFDDVISMPFKRATVAERIARQVGQPQVYYETPGYFGPDRRDRVTGPRRAAESRLCGQFRRLEIVRNLMSGVDVLRDDLHIPA